MRVGLARVWTCGELPAASLLSIAAMPGQRLSLSRKSEVVRAGEWVVKRSRVHRGAGPLRLTAQRRRYRRSFEAARTLVDAGVGLPELGGYIEWGVGGLIWRNATITRYLSRHRTIREFALQQQDADDGTVAAFLEAVADAVLTLKGFNAYHSDLAYKNVLTNNGTDIRFVDLDSLRIGRPQTRAEQLRNHIQLLDAFYDLWPERHLDPFLRKMAPADVPFEQWTTAVVRGLEARIRRRSAFERRALRHIERQLGRRGE